jgi:hypothetical protein
MTSVFGRGSAPGRARSAQQRPGSFKRGHPKMGGRKKGTPNRIPGIFKKALYEATDRVGFAGSGEDGSIGYFVWIGRRYPTFYYLNIFGRGITMDDDDITVLETTVPETTVSEATSPSPLKPTERGKLGRRGIGQNERTRAEPQGPMPLAEMSAMVGTMISTRDPRITYEDMVRVLMRLAIDEPKTFCKIWAGVFLIPVKKPRPWPGSHGVSDFELDRSVREFEEMLDRIIQARKSETCNQESK